MFLKDMVPRNVGGQIQREIFFLIERHIQKTFIPGQIDFLNKDRKVILLCNSVVIPANLKNEI